MNHRRLVGQLCNAAVRRVKWREDQEMRNQCEKK